MKMIGEYNYSLDKIYMLSWLLQNVQLDRSALSAGDRTSLRRSKPSVRGLFSSKLIEGVTRKELRRGYLPTLMYLPVHTI